MLVRNKKNNGILVGVIAFLFVLIVGVTIAVIAISTSKSGDSGSTTTDTNGTTDSNVKQNPDEGDSDDPDVSGDDPTNDDLNKRANVLKIDINQASVSGDTMSIRTNINQYLTDGTCELNLTGPQNQKYQTATQIIANSDASSTCNGFDIDLQQIEKKRDNRYGKWTIELKVTSDKKSGTAKKEITI